MPKVSVIIPTYNRAKFLPRAIQSVKDQSFRDFELIIVDDGSTDETPQVVQSVAGDCRYIRKENGGSASARNAGIQESKGRYIAFLDSDDFWMPEKLAEQVKVLDANPKIGIVYARMPIINDKGETIGMKPAGVSGKNFKELLELWGDLPTSTVMTRRECFDKAGLFDTELTTMQDIDMWLRIARFYDLYEIEGKVLSYYCRHGDQITKNKMKVYCGLVKIYTKILDNFKEAPRELMMQRIALNQYLISRLYYNEGQYQKALRHFHEAFDRYPLVGLLLIAPASSVFQKIIVCIKAYSYWLVCSLKALFNAGRITPKGNS